MTIAVGLGGKATKQTNKQNNLLSLGRGRYSFEKRVRLSPDVLEYTAIRTKHLSKMFAVKPV